MSTQVRKRREAGALLQREALLKAIRPAVTTDDLEDSARLSRARAHLQAAQAALRELSAPTSRQEVSGLHSQLVDAVDLLTRMSARGTR